MVSKKFLYPNLIEENIDNNISGNLYNVISNNNNLGDKPENNIINNIDTLNDGSHEDNSNDNENIIESLDTENSITESYVEQPTIDIEYIKEESYENGYRVGYEKCKEEIINDFDYGVNNISKTLQEKLNDLEVKDFNHIYGGNISKALHILCNKFFIKLPIDTENLVEKMLLEHISKIRQYTKIEIIAESSILDKIKSHVSNTSIKDKIVYNNTNDGTTNVRIIIDNTEVSFSREALINSISNLLDNK